jgi:hypothetical protein
MTDFLQEAEVADPRTVRRATLIRLATGLIQGLLLYGLWQADKSKVWPATQREVYAAFLMIALFVPFVGLAGISALRLRTLAVWKGVAALIAGGLGAYGVWSADPAAQGVNGLGPQTFLAIAALVFIGHHLVQPADMERRRIARYPTYFDVTWKHGVQGALSAGFTGAFWLLLFLAAALFKLIGVDAIEKLIQHEWFIFPASAVMFAAAVQLTDVRANLVRGVRTVALTLLAWLLPLMALIAAAFLLTLPFTGLEPLWKTKSATAILLIADAFLILLANAAYQDGTEKTAVVLRWAARLAGVLLVPITVLAAYGLSLRIGQYGLSPDRIVAAACVLVAAGYAIGYTLAAVRPGDWMKVLETTNVAMAFVVIAVLLALFTPIADPRRLSVDDQVGRLKAGKVKPDAFDYVALRFDDGRYGREALAAFERHADPVIRKKAIDTAKLESRPYATGLTAALASYAGTRVFPKGQVLPKSFVDQPWNAGDAPYCSDGERNCRALLIDTDGDGAVEVLLGGGMSFDVFKADATGVWKKIGEASGGCEAISDKALEAGDVRLAPSAPTQDLVIGEKRMRIEPTPSCDPAEALATALARKRP